MVAPLPPVTFAQPDEPSADCSHWILPVCPLTLTVVELPEQIGLRVAVAVPPTDVGFIVIVLVAETTVQPPAPSGSFVVKVKTTVCGVEAVGVNVIEAGVAEDTVEESVPVPEVIDQAALEADPPIDTSDKLSAEGLSL